MFRKLGIQHLFLALNSIRDQNPDVEICLNVTGGYKSVVPFVTLYGLIHRLDVIYLHETSGDLIHLPPVPLSFDFERLGQIRDALVTLREKETMEKKAFLYLLPPEARMDSEWYRSLVEEEDSLVAPSGMAELFFKETDSHTFRVLISPEAQQTLDASSGPVRTQYLGMLQRVADPLWRKSKSHAVRGTDLTVFKPGNTSERLMGYIKGSSVYVCELAQHDRYEKILRTRKKEDYPETGFRTYAPPEDAAELALSEDAEMDALRETIANLKKDNETLYRDVEATEKQLSREKEQYEQMRDKQKEEFNLREDAHVQQIADMIKKHSEETRSLETDKETLKQELASLRNQQDQREAQLQALQNYVSLPWWRRIRRFRPEFNEANAR